MKKNIVIVGGGAGGMELATSLGKKLGKKNKANIILIDKSLTHVWKPLFHEIAAGTLNNLADEINYLSHSQYNGYRFQLGQLTHIERINKYIRLENPFDNEGKESIEIKYDSLILSFGGVSNNFNTLGADKNCFTLDSLEEAKRIHKQLLTGIINDQYSKETKIFNVVIIGGGATGIEFAAELHFASQQLDKIYKGKQENRLQITVVEAADRVLSTLPERVSNLTIKKLNDYGISILTTNLVKSVEPNGLTTSNGNFIESDLTVWAAGVKGHYVVNNLCDFELTNTNLIKVKPSLQTTVDDSIFAMGDCAACQMLDSSSLVPAKAQSAHQQAEFLKKVIPLYINNSPLPKFKYKDQGSLVSLSHNNTIGVLMGKLHKNLLIEGWFARVGYLMLYKLHQAKLFGWYNVTLFSIGNFFMKHVRSKVKLH
ncbi:MAG: NADH dehydrogenase [Francisellaceae bacterium]|jgi:NADH dehydrogenase